MSERGNAFRIGIFVMVGVAIVIAGLFLFGIRSALQPKDMFETYTTGSAEGLTVGSVVTLRGVQIGKVIEIGFSWNLYNTTQPGCVVVRCAVNQHIVPAQWGRSNFEAEMKKVVDRGMRAVVQMEGITGSSIVALQFLDPAQYPPLQVPWKPKYSYIPSAPSQLGRLLTSLDRTLANLEKLNVGEIGQKLSRDLDTANSLLKNLNQLDVKGISNNANKALVDADGAVLEIKRLADGARQDIHDVKLGAIGNDARKLLDDLDARLAVLLEKLSGVDVRSLNETLAGTRDAARSLNQALDELKRYPSGFLFGPAPPPAPVLEQEKK
jgi:phospholipid/cholesterol/gamma-HCH transport system substrate-binding protein